MRLQFLEQDIRRNLEKGIGNEEDRQTEIILRARQMQIRSQLQRYPD